MSKGGEVGSLNAEVGSRTIRNENTLMTECPND